MKKLYYILIYLALVVIGLLIFWFSGLEQIKINLIIILIAIYIVMKPIKSIAAYLFKKRVYRVIISITINLIWSFFGFWLLFLWSVDLFIAIISFLVVSISLNFNKIINNIASGVIILGSEQIETGDLIQTNGIQGIVKEITLNYVKIQEFDGVNVVIPNANVYGSSIVKFTHNRFKILKRLEKEEFEKKRDYKRYIKQLNKMLNAKIKTTTYAKSIEVSVNSTKLDEILNPIFEKYIPIFGIKPEFAVDTTLFGRVRLILYLKSDNPRTILNYIDSFLRDVLYQIYPNEIFENWKDNNKKVESER